MRESRSYWPFYTVSVVAWLVVIAIPSIREMGMREEVLDREFYASVSAVTEAEVAAQLDRFKQLVAQPGPVATYREDALNALGSLHLQCDKMTVTEGRNNIFGLCYSVTMDGAGTIQGELEQAYSKKYGFRALQSSLYDYTQKHGNELHTRTAPLPATADLWLHMWLWWLPFSSFMLMLRLNAEGLSVLRELIGVPWRFALATVSSPVSFAYYPRTDIVEQRIQSLRFAALTLGSLLCGGAGVAKAQSGDSGSKKDQKRTWSLTLSASGSSRYMGAISIEIFPEPVFTQSATLTHTPSGIYVGVWNSVSPKGGLNSDFGDETDVVVGKKWENRWFTIDGGIMYFDVFPLDTRTGDLYDVYTSIAIPGKHLTPYARTDWVLPRNRDVLEGGLSYRAGARISIGPVSADLSVSGHDGVVGFRPERISSGRAVISATRTFFKKVTASPYLAFQQRFGPAGGIAKSRAWFGLNLSYQFNQ